MTTLYCWTRTTSHRAWFRLQDPAMVLAGDGIPRVAAAVSNRLTNWEYIIIECGWLSLD
jgi:hypothetical protein